MNIILNNKPESFNASSMTVRELLQIKNFTFRLLVVKINSRLVKRDQYDETVITDGDHVMVMHLVSGG